MGLGDNLKQAGSNFVNNWNNMDNCRRVKEKAK